jgi:hypothetical protein
MTDKQGIAQLIVLLGSDRSCTQRFCMRVVFHGCRSFPWQVAIVNLPALWVKESVLPFCTQTSTTPFHTVGLLSSNKESICMFKVQYICMHRHKHQVHMFTRSSEEITMVRSGASYSGDFHTLVIHVWNSQASFLQDEYTYSDNIKYEEVGSYYQSTLDLKWTRLPYPLLPFLTLNTISAGVYCELPGHQAVHLRMETVQFRAKGFDLHLPWYQTIGTFATVSAQLIHS